MPPRHAIDTSDWRSTFMANSGHNWSVPKSFKRVREEYLPSRRARAAHSVMVATELGLFEYDTQTHHWQLANTYPPELSKSGTVVDLASFQDSWVAVFESAEVAVIQWHDQVVDHSPWRRRATP